MRCGPIRLLTLTQPFHDLTSSLPEPTQPGMTITNIMQKDEGKRRSMGVTAKNYLPDAGNLPQGLDRCQGNGCDSGTTAAQWQHGGGSLHNELAAGNHEAARGSQTEMLAHHSNEVIIPPNLSDHQMKLNKIVINGSVPAVTHPPTGQDPPLALLASGCHYREKRAKTRHITPTFSLFHVTRFKPKYCVRCFKKYIFC